MKVAVIGSGGREHALAWICAKSPSVEKIYVIPGNPGTGKIARNVDLDPLDFQGIADFCHREDVDLVVVGPEGPLAQGIADYLEDQEIRVFGPSKKGALLESSKGYARDFMARHDIAHPDYLVCDSAQTAFSYIESHKAPYVLKADGLAFGKGVMICQSKEEAKEVVKDMTSGKLFGQAGEKVVLEEFLKGQEATAMALFDGTRLLHFPLAQDHKRLKDGEKGPMTGGMGAYAPFETDGEEIERKIREGILERTALGLKKEGIDFRGVIYAGLMITDDGPKVLEYNVRFGDPETQCVMPLLEGDLAQAFLDCSQGRLKSSPYFRVKPGYCATVVMASQGYPGKYEKGFPILGLDQAGKEAGKGRDEMCRTMKPKEDVVVFHAGTKEVNGQVVTWGGRVLSVAAIGDTLASCRQKAYDAVAGIQFQGAFYRRDIAENAKPV